MHFDRHLVAVTKMKCIPQLHVGGNFDDGLGMVAAALLVRIGSQQQGASSKDRAWNQTDRDSASVF